MRRALPLTLLALALAGCGTTAPQSSVDNFKDGDQRAVAQKIEDLADAGKRNKPDDICSDILAQALVSSSTPRAPTARPR